MLSHVFACCDIFACCDKEELVRLNSYFTHKQSPHYRHQELHPVPVCFEFCAMPSPDCQQSDYFLPGNLLWSDDGLFPFYLILFLANMTERQTVLQTGCGELQSDL
jgi:hypothetical protein